MRYIHKETWTERYERGGEVSRPRTRDEVTAFCDVTHEDGQQCPFCFGKVISAVPEGARRVEDTGFVGEGRTIFRQSIYED